MDKMRQEFEEWWKTQREWFTPEYCDGCYAWQDAEDAWQA